MPERLAIGAVVAAAEAARSPTATDIGRRSTFRKVAVAVSASRIDNQAMVWAPVRV